MVQRIDWLIGETMGPGVLSNWMIFQAKEAAVRREWG